jgi:hypothetical protein
MPKYKLGEEMMRLFNPLPPPTTRELVKVCDFVGMVKVDDHPVFRVEHVWSAGAERETITIDPGQVVEMPKKMAMEIQRLKREQGIVLLSKNSDPVESAREGLQSALAFYRGRGSMQVQKFRARHGVTKDDEQWQLLRTEIPGAVMNMEKERMVMQALRAVDDDATLLELDQREE